MANSEGKKQAIAYVAVVAAKAAVLTITGKEEGKVSILSKMVQERPPVTEKDLPYDDQYSI